MSMDDGLHRRWVVKEGELTSYGKPSSGGRPKNPFTNASTSSQSPSRGGGGGGHRAFHQGRASHQPPPPPSSMQKCGHALTPKKATKGKRRWLHTTHTDEKHRQTWRNAIKVIKECTELIQKEERGQKIDAEEEEEEVRHHDRPDPQADKHTLNEIREQIRAMLTVSLPCRSIASSVRVK